MLCNCATVLYLSVFLTGGKNSRDLRLRTKFCVVRDKTLFGTDGECETYLVCGTVCILDVWLF